MDSPHDHEGPRSFTDVDDGHRTDLARDHAAVAVATDIAPRPVRGIEKLHEATLDVGGVVPLHDVQFTPWIRRAAWILLVLMLIGPTLAAFAPWQQYVLGTGRVIAFGPNYRPQVIKARIDGIVEKVHVIEADYVEKDQPLVEIKDNDPNRLARLQETVFAAQQDVDANKAQIGQLDTQVEFLQNARDEKKKELDAKVQEAKEKLTSAREKLMGSKVLRDFQLGQLGNFERLLEKEAIPGLTVGKAKAELGKTQAEVRSNEAAVRSAEAALLRAKAERDGGLADADAKIAKANAYLNEVRAKVATSTIKLVEAQSKFDAQKTQDHLAPLAGRIFRVYANPGSGVVKKGDPLVEIVPVTRKSAVEIYVSGNDAPLIDPGRRVRLQFEGYPAVQWVAGWPEVALGTFGGIVSRVDASDSGNGRFRLLITPDPDDEPWPEESRFLRQGTRTKGWVMLEQVPLWYEIWRQLNAFPPVISQSAPKKSDDPAKLQSK